LANSNYRKSSPYLAALTPIRNWREIGLDAAAHYFNSGVMVLNLARWRRERIHEKLLSCLRDYPRHVWCWDQYALNVVFAGQWRPLPMRWNQGAHAFEFPSVEHSPIEFDEFVAMRDDPAVIHFTTEFKPWHYNATHPLRAKFFEELDKTAWRGWRPSRPDFDLNQWWTKQAVNWTKRFYITYRKCAAMWVNP
jgi:lipopolysaccharide biosynthesis glycosyltransferase